MTDPTHPLHTWIGRRIKLLLDAHTEAIDEYTLRDAGAEFGGWILVADPHGEERVLFAHALAGVRPLAPAPGTDTGRKGGESVTAHRLPSPRRDGTFAGTARGDFLRHVAEDLHEQGATAAEIHEVLLRVNAERCRPPLQDVTLKAMVESSVKPVPAVVPDPLLERVGRIYRGEEPVPPRLREGLARGSYLHGVARTVLKEGASAVEMAIAVAEANHRGCRPPLTPEDLERLSQEAWARWEEERASGPGLLRRPAPGEWANGAADV